MESMQQVQVYLKTVSDEYIGTQSDIFGHDIICSDYIKNQMEDLIINILINANIKNHNTLYVQNKIFERVLDQPFRDQIHRFVQKYYQLIYH